MRKALLVVTLVAAAFAGGAAVNGPGLKWVKSLITSRLRPGPAIPTVEVDAPPPGVTTTAEAPAPAPVDPLADIPSTPAPPLVPDLLASSPPSPSPPPTPEPVPVKTEGAEPSAVPSPAPVLVAEPPAETPQADPPAAVAVDLPKTGADTPNQPRGIGWADAPGEAPAIAVLPDPQPQPQTRKDPGPISDHAVAAASAGSDRGPASSSGWAAVRKRMKAMGVKRYWIEGTPTGSVTFRCVVPVPGQDAVSQQFEAEGEDDLDAAEVALRRASLWQASQRLK